MEPGADGVVIGGDGGEGLGGQPAARLQGQASLAAVQLVERGGVLLRGGDGGDIVKVLGGGADGGGTADVDVLDDLVRRAARPGHRGGERVEVADHQVDRLDTVLFQGG